MKIGTSIVWLVIILIVFGYVLSDNQHMRKDLSEAIAQAEGLSLQVGEADRKLSSCQKLVQDGQQAISQYRMEIASLNNSMTLKEDEIQFLKSLISQQTVRITELEGNLAKAPAATPESNTVQSTSTWLPSDPIVWVAILMVQVALFLLQRRQKNGYVRLSAEERAHIIKLRRMKKR